ncbi:MAG: N-acetyltransferase family protein [Phycisphaerales bacterium]
MSHAADTASIMFATPDDAADIAAIYAPFVRETAISFEAVPPTTDDFAARIERGGRLYPWLVLRIAPEGGRGSPGRSATEHAAGNPVAGPAAGPAAGPMAQQVAQQVAKQATNPADHPAASPTRNPANTGATAATDGPPIVGYAYAGPHRARAAYRWSVETSIYLHTSAHGRGLGRLLYGTLLELVERQGFAAAYGGLTLPNPASRGLHVAVGFETVGIYRRCGRKFGRWHDAEWLQCMLGAADPLASPDSPDSPNASNASNASGRSDAPEPPEPQPATNADLDAAIAAATITAAASSSAAGRGPGSQPSSASPPAHPRIPGPASP